MSVETRLTQPDSHQHTVFQSPSQETMSQRADDQVPTDIKKKVLLLAGVFSGQIIDDKIDISGTWMHPPEGQRFASSSSAHVRTSNCKPARDAPPIRSQASVQHTHTHTALSLSATPVALETAQTGSPSPHTHTISRVTSREKRGSFIAI